jgi:hypothetical protein
LAIDKRILFASDLHCGSKVGLTPPDWNRKLLKKDKTKSNKYTLIRKEAWDRFAYIVKQNKPIDRLVLDGDLIDGLDYKHAGTDLLINNRLEQAQMVLDIIEFIDPQKIAITYGSDYHVSANGEEWENIIATECKAKIGVEEWLNVNGVVFNVKHHVGRSSIPHGRTTPLSKAVLWKLLWKEYKDFPGADIYVRGHVHYFQAYKDSKYLAMTLPALKALGDTHAAKYYDDVIDFGAIVFDVTSKGNYAWKDYICNIKYSIPKVMEF